MLKFTSVRASEQTDTDASRERKELFVLIFLTFFYLFVKYSIPFVPLWSLKRFFLLRLAKITQPKILKKISQTNLAYFEIFPYIELK